MDLHRIVSGAIGSVNPFILASIQKNTGYTTSGSGARTPSYAAAVSGVRIQKQATTAEDLKHIDNMNIQGEVCTVYMEGVQYPVNRITQQGGDLFTFGGNTWLVVALLEMWPDWCKLVLCLQRPSA